MSVNDYKSGEYLSYNGMNRPAMVLGVPLMFCIALLIFIVFICLPLYMLFGLIVGIIPTMLSIISFVIVKAISENDPNALAVLFLKIKGFSLFGFKRILGVRGNV